MFVRKGRGVWSYCCPVNVLPCPALACLALLPLDASTALWGWAGTAANDRYRAEDKFGASCDLVREQQDDEVSGDGAGGTVQVKVHPGSLPLPHE